MGKYKLRRTRFLSEKKALWAILILSLIGIIISSYLVYLKFDLESKIYCPISGCDIVNTSEYSKIFGVPVALIGLAGFLLIFFLGLCRLVRPRKSNEMFIEIMLLLSIMGTAFGVYLTYLELFVIHAVCIYCATCFVIMIVILALLLLLFFGFGFRAASSDRGDDNPD